MLKGANRIQWRIRFLEMNEVSATDLHMSRKFQNFFESRFPVPNKDHNKDLQAFLRFRCACQLGERTFPYRETLIPGGDRSMRHAFASSFNSISLACC